MRVNPNQQRPLPGDPPSVAETGDPIRRIVEAVVPHGRTMLAAGAAILAAAAAWIMIGSQMEATRARSWDAYLDAMAAASSGEPADAVFQDVIQRHPDTIAADWSRLRLAEIRLAAGTNAAFTDRVAAARDFDAAVGILKGLLASRPKGLLGEFATFSLAKAREGLGDFEQARKGYEAVVREHPGGPTASAARRRVEALGSASTAAWYDWMQKQDLVAARPAEPPSATDEPGAKTANDSADSDANTPTPDASDPAKTDESNRQSDGNKSEDPGSGAGPEEAKP